MTIYDLNDDEVALLERYRDDQLKRTASLLFKRNAIATAKAFDDWSATTGEGLTFSTFINSFRYQGVDGKQMFDAVVRINQAASPQ